MNLTPRPRREFVRFLRFMVVGSIGAVVDFGTFNILTAVLLVWSLLASALSFTAAVTSNFLWNRYWTYPDSRSKPVHHQATQFVLVNLVGLAIRTPVYWLSEKPMIRLMERALPSLRSGPLADLAAHIPFDATFIGRDLALAIAVILVLFWNFAVNRLWTYSDVQ